MSTPVFACVSGRCVGGDVHAGFPVALLRLHGGQGVRHHRVGGLQGTSYFTLHTTHVHCFTLSSIILISEMNCYLMSVVFYFL